MGQRKMSIFNYLPCYILNHSPKIIAAFEMDFLRNLPAFQKAIPQKEKFTLFLQLGWAAELPEVAAELKSRLEEAKNAFEFGSKSIFSKKQRF